MKPIKFKEVNVTFAENQDEYLPLPAFRSDEPEGQIVSCWKLTFIERVRILFIGKLWVSLMMFGKPLTPMFFTTKKSEILIIKDD